MNLDKPFTDSCDGYVDRLNIKENAIRKELAKILLDALKQIDDKGFADLTTFYWRVCGYGYGKKTIKNIFSMEIEQNKKDIILLQYLPI